MRMSLRSSLRPCIAVMAFLLAIAMLGGSAQAIGVTPGRTTVDFEPGLEKEVTFTVINNDQKEMRVLVYAEGDLKDYITAEKNFLEFKETDESKAFTYKFRLPDNIEKPGDHWTKIMVMEMPPEEGEEGQVIMSTVAVVHQLRVKVPYPGKYAELDLVIHEAEPGEEVAFFVKVDNLGTEKIQKAFATIDILGPTNEKIAIIESGEASVDPKTRGEIIVHWKADVNPGVYHAVVTLNYDGVIARAEKNFGVGAMRVDVLDIIVRDFELGGIAKFEVNVENKWNQRIDGVYGEIIMSDQEGNQITSFKSASVDIEPLQRASLYAYWDTEGVEKGEYESKLILHYAEKTSEKIFKTYVGLEGIETEIVGVTARAITRREGGAGPAADILVPLVVILIMINMVWLFYFRRRGK